MLKKIFINQNIKLNNKKSIISITNSIYSNNSKNNGNIYGIKCMNISKKYYTTSNIIRTSSSSQPSSSSSSVTSTPIEQSPSSSLTSTPIEQLPPIDLSNLDVAAAIVDNGEVIAIAPQLGYSPTHLCMSLIENVHIMADVPYWVTIAGLTVALRIVLLPVAIKTVQNAARMAALRPDMLKVQDAFTKNPNQNDNAVRLKFQTEMKGLFKKYKVNPFQAMMMPIFQLPLFLTFFFGLQSMGDVFPAFAEGGAFWFTNLSIGDPYLILPIYNAASFILMIEMGADGIQTQDQTMFKNIMRVLAVAMVPLTMNMPAGVFVYWSCNNTFSIVQTAVLKTEALRKMLDIPEPPKNAPALKMKNPFQDVMDAFNKERAQSEDARAQIVDGSMPPPPPPLTSQIKPPSMTNLPPRHKKSNN